MNISLSGSRTAATAHATPPSKRRFGHGFDEDEEEPQERKASLTGYDGSSRTRKSTPPRVIPVSGGSDWREDRRKRLARAEAAREGVNGVGNGASNGSTNTTSSNADRINSEEQKSGLQVHERRREITDSMDVDVPTPTEPQDLAPTQPQSEDDLARQALLTGQLSSSATLNSNRTIALSTPTEEEAFRSDASSRPDAPTLDDYAATPVEEFGKALLRGMGWKEGMGVARPAEVKKRSALLGLGATERVLPGEEAKGKSKVTQKRPDIRGYKPLVRREMDGRREGDGKREDRDGDRYSSSNGSRRRDRERDNSPPPSSSSSSPRHERDRTSHRSHRARSRSRSPVSSSSSRHDDRRRDRDRDRHRSRRDYDDRDRDRERQRDRERRR